MVFGTMCSLDSKWLESADTSNVPGRMGMIAQVGSEQVPVSSAGESVVVGTDVDQAERRLAAPEALACPIIQNVRLGERPNFLEKPLFDYMDSYPYHGYNIKNVPARARTTPALTALSGLGRGQQDYDVVSEDHHLHQRAASSPLGLASEDINTNNPGVVLSGGPLPTNAAQELQQHEDPSVPPLLRRGPPEPETPAYDGPVEDFFFDGSIVPIEFSEPLGAEPLVASPADRHVVVTGAADRLQDAVVTGAADRLQDVVVTGVTCTTVGTVAGTSTIPATVEKEQFLHEPPGGPARAGPPADDRDDRLLPILEGSNEGSSPVLRPSSPVQGSNEGSSLDRVVVHLESAGDFFDEEFRPPDLLSSSPTDAPGTAVTCSVHEQDTTTTTRGFVTGPLSFRRRPKKNLNVTVPSVSSRVDELAKAVSPPPSPKSKPVDQLSPRQQQDRIPRGTQMALLRKFSPTRGISGMGVKTGGLLLEPVPLSPKSPPGELLQHQCAVPPQPLLGNINSEFFEPPRAPPAALNNHPAGGPLFPEQSPSPGPSPGPVDPDAELSSPFLSLSPSPSPSPPRSRQMFQRDCVGPPNAVPLEHLHRLVESSRPGPVERRVTSKDIRAEVYSKVHPPCCTLPLGCPCMYSPTRTVAEVYSPTRTIRSSRRSFSPPSRTTRTSSRGGPSPSKRRDPPLRTKRGGRGGPQQDLQRGGRGPQPDVQRGGRRGPQEQDLQRGGRGPQQEDFQTHRYDPRLLTFGIFIQSQGPRVMMNSTEDIVLCVPGHVCV